MGVYVHIPFCEQKCSYCDFYSVVVGAGEFSSLTDNYLVSLRQEALYYRALWGDSPLTTIFFGGGTPSLLPPEKLADLIAFLRTELPFVTDPEITIEANPHSLTEAGAEALAAAGVNRVSLGAQSFQDDFLKAIGRLHRAEQISESVRSLRRAGIDNINLDLIFGLPGQSVRHWQETLEQAAALQPTHLSCYALILEPGTPLAAWHEAGLVQLPNDDDQADMYGLARSLLRSAGYEHYEISNFCLPGCACQHNLLYWRNRPHIALGTAAAGYVNRCRYINAPDLHGYLQSWQSGNPNYLECEQVGVEQEMDDTMMVGMRLIAGVAEEEFRHRFGVSYWDVYGEEITELVERGLVVEVEGSLRVTEQGLFLENMVSGAFLRGAGPLDKGGAK